VTVRAFRQTEKKGKQSEITAAGYEFVLEPAIALPAVTGDTGKNMRVLNL
jgi:hypothetical protein